ncbi:uncharacterized protein I206_105075 [Kwoniella pini CBS 10737]|uniref:histone acetyltransferase n=1 Tax=Kwoniella pini CBS 10737 TaxID=1296096 RepID=A0AAJ8MRW0_9TREE
MPIRLSNSDNATPSSQIRVLISGKQYVIKREGHTPRIATILDTRVNKAGVSEVYISDVGEEVSQPEAGPSNHSQSSQVDTPSKVNLEDETGHSTQLDRTKRAEDSPRSNASTPEREHAAMTRVRNFEDVRFGEYLIKTWYYSPYPLPLNDSSQSHTQNPHTPQPESSSSKKRKLTHNSSFTSNKDDPTISGIDQSHRPNLKHGRTVNEMYSGVGKGGEGARGRLWACDLCFKYMKTRAGWDRHTSSCSMLQPPGRKVYQRGSYTIWEVDGAKNTLYCQNLSLFGKLFIDHKSVFFHVENFLFYVLCDAATSKRDQVMAFFSKEKLSYDDFNLACIVTFPPFQNRGFGKLLIEFSYYLTRYSKSPGTPERPLSDLGLKGYTAYWVSVILRFFKSLLSESIPFKEINESNQKIKSPIKPKTSINGEEGRVLRIRKSISSISDHNQYTKEETRIKVGNSEYKKIPIINYKGQYTISITLEEISKSCHLRIDDVAFTLCELGFLINRRKIIIQDENEIERNDTKRNKNTILSINHNDNNDEENEENDIEENRKLKEIKYEHEHEISEEWKNLEIVITKEMIEIQWNHWKIREKGVLEDEFVLL